jgi:hypothetical protein
MNRSTIFSADRKYRYVLWREWESADSPYALFVGLNPSTADERTDDPTIRRCVGFARSWGYGALCMVNLFACRATEPSVLKSHPAPIGRHNDRWLIRMAEGARVIVAAWGVHGTHLQRDQVIRNLLGDRLRCLETTKDGHPRHPLYLKSTLAPRVFEWSA